MAVQLTQRWEEGVWGRVARLVAEGDRGSEIRPVVRMPRRQVQRRLSEGESAQIVAEYEAGATVHALSVKYRVDDKTVQLRVRRAGVALRPAKKPLPVSELGEIRRLRAAGWSLARIGEKYDRSFAAIRVYLLKHEGVET